MEKQNLQLMNLRDLCRFHRYVRRNGIQGTVRQMQYCANARNTLWLAVALPLDDACLEVQAVQYRDDPKPEAGR